MKFMTLQQPICVLQYGAFPFMTMGQVFNNFLIADGKPGLGMGISVFGTIIGATGNAMVLFVFNMGIYALAWTTVLGTGITTIWYFVIFLRNKTGNFRFAMPSMDRRTFVSLLINGFSVGAPMSAGAIMMTVQNNVLVNLEGVGAMGIAGMVMGMQGMLGQVFAGYMQGISGIIAFNRQIQHSDIISPAPNVRFVFFDDLNGCTIQLFEAKK